MGVLLNGIAGSLFIASSELFISAKQFDVWSISDSLEKYLDENFKKKGQDWAQIKKEMWPKCGVYERRGRLIYDSALIVLFLALGFIIGPYNLPIAVVTSSLGIGLELYQTLRKV